MASEFCVRNGFDIHFIDAEWLDDYVTATELDTLVESSEEHDTHLTTIITLNARHTETPNILEEYVEVATQHRNVGFCFVAGNRAYLSEEELRLDAALRIRDLVAQARGALRSAPIFVGSEGQLELTMELAAKHSTIPFTLMNRSVDLQVSRLLSNNDCSGVGVYCPYLPSEEGNGELLIRTLGQYALRRKWVKHELRRAGFSPAEVLTQISEAHSLEKHARQILIDCIQKLALCNHTDVRRTVRKFSSLGVRYLALLPAIELSEMDSTLLTALNTARKEGGKKMRRQDRV